MNIITGHHDFDSNKALVFLTWLSVLICGHVNFNILRRLVKIDLLFFIKIDIYDKYEICTEAKMTKLLFLFIERNIKLLEIISF